LIVTGVADTHTALWYLYADPRLSLGAKHFIHEAGQTESKIAVSSITLVEVVYLVEKARILPSAYEDLIDVLEDPAHVFVETPVSGAIARSMRSLIRAEVPDMPDRIIAATGVYLGVPPAERGKRAACSGR
jgi:PIN domain nuclease of toxin-antitoxin system